MSTQIDTEEIQTTRSEKLLAVVLAVFLLIGGVWIYFKLDDIPDEPSPAGPSVFFAPELSEEPGPIQRLRQAEQRAARASSNEQRARQELELRRERYRTALDAGRPAGALEASYNRAQTSYENARRRTAAARARVTQARPAAAAAQRHQETSARDAQREFDAAQRKHDREAFLLRLVYVLGCLGVAYWLLDRVRRRRPRYLVVALAFVGFAAAQALVMGGDYLYDYVEFTEAGPLTISLVGVAMTLVAFVALQRYLARRLPMRRVRRRECPFCAFPVTDNERCEGCGRTVFANCTSCDNRRRVGTAHCGTCGAV